VIARRGNLGPMPRPIDTSALGPIRIDHAAHAARLQRADEVLSRHWAIGVPSTRAERRRWVLDAMLAFADAERDRR
jgi:hypothetical protein